MVVIATDNQQPGVADVVLVVEATANLGAYLDILKPQYIVPTLEYFNGGPPDPTDYGQDNSCTLYNIVYFHSGDVAPEPAARCTNTTTSTHTVLDWLDKLPYIGGVGDAYSHITEGLGTALQVFDEIKKLRDKSLKTERHCILICNSPPYQLPCQESHCYLGYLADQMASMMGKQGINLSIISPRKIPGLQKLFDESNTEVHTMPLKDYCVDPKHMVLLHGYKLKEQSHSPNLEEEKQANERLSSILNTVTNSPKAGSRRGHSPPNTMAALLADNPTPFKIPSSVPGQANLQMPMATSSATVGQPSIATLTSQPPVSHPQSQHPLQQQIPTPVTQTHQTIPTNQQILNNQTNIPQSMAELKKQQAAQRQNMIRAQQQQQAGMMPQQPNMTHRNPAQTMMTPNAQQSMMHQQQQQQPTMAQIQVSQSQGSIPQQVSSFSTQQTKTLVNPQPSMSQGDIMMQPNMSGQNESIAMGQAPFGNPEQPMGTIAPINTPNMIRAPAPPQRTTVWTGALEWQEKSKVPGLGSSGKLTRSLACTVSIAQGEADLNASKWPNKLIMQLIPHSLLNPLNDLLCRSQMVSFHFAQTDLNALKNLYKVLFNGFAGCVHFHPITQCEVRMLILLYNNEKRMFVGMIPKNQMEFVNGIRQVITSSKNQQKQKTKTLLNPQPHMVSQPNVSQGDMMQPNKRGQNQSIAMGQAPFGNPEQPMGTIAPINTPNMIRAPAPPQRTTVWTGALEWQEKSKVPGLGSSGKLTRSLACTVSIAQGEADLNTSKWPNKLIMQLIPHSLLNPLNDLLRRSQMVSFHFAQTDLNALKNLYKVLFNGFAGFVHFHPITQREVRMLILLYNKKKKMFVGRIPKNQMEFVNGIRQVITSSKNQQKQKGDMMQPNKRGQNQSIAVGQAPFGNPEQPMGTIAPINTPNMIRTPAPPQRTTVWTGALEWQEKSKVPGLGSSGKLTRSLACTVSIAQGEVDLNTSKWPNKLIMQLIPHSLLNPLNDLLRRSQMVSFHFAQTDLNALKNLYKVLFNGFAGCVHFHPITQREVRMLILLYNKKKRMFVGRIPKNQMEFVNGIRQVITSSKNQQKQKVIL
ncbi:mediator of RNA polymerase II transcription subunit 25-like isoform X2 [Liolophura sinensis]|uniref:mediator of RNA polymerase II transcription subunit 25-like isoform X2 n=1 Tax=Liolophura sinensis TaxID=3198878 RepID=UPI0031594F4B